MKKRNHKNPKRNGVQVRLDDKTFERLKSDAETERTSPAEILRRSYEQYQKETQ